MIDPTIKRSLLRNVNIVALLDAAANGDRKLIKRLLTMGVRTAVDRLK